MYTAAQLKLISWLEHPGGRPAFTSSEVDEALRGREMRDLTSADCRGLKARLERQKFEGMIDPLEMAARAAPDMIRLPKGVDHGEGEEDGRAEEGVGTDAGRDAASDTSGTEASGQEGGT